MMHEQLTLKQTLYTVKNNRNFNGKILTVVNNKTKKENVSNCDRSHDTFNVILL